MKRDDAGSTLRKAAVRQWAENGEACEEPPLNGTGKG